MDWEDYDADKAQNVIMNFTILPKKGSNQERDYRWGGALFDGYHVTMASQRLLNTFQVF